MALISLMEVFDAIVMTLAIGFIFKDSFLPAVSKARSPYDFLKKKRFDFSNFWFACAIVAPVIILHELAHKFTAIAFGMSAVFMAPYLWLLFGVALKLMNFGLIFFIPAYVQITGVGTNLHFGLIAFAGPLVHLILWLGSWLILAKKKKMTKKTEYVLFLMKRINMFLFILNMLPIPGLDGFKVYSAIWQMIF